MHCDDLRPANVLVDEGYKIVAVIDWEFTYAAPREFTYSPPWWQLLEKPEEWDSGPMEWAKAYEPRLDTFLRVLRQEEDAAIQRGSLAQTQRLSPRMSRSLDSGEFWINYAVQRSWAFDGLFWIYIDASYFGNGKGLGFEKRLHLLSDADRDAVEDFVKMKLEQQQSRNSVDWEARGVDETS